MPTNSIPVRLPVLLFGALAPVAVFVAPAPATWSILIADTRTGEIAVASATCVPGIDLRASTPVLLLGRGAATAQSVVDSSGANRVRILTDFARGLTPEVILDNLAASDPGHGNRQYGIIDAIGNAVTYSGPQNAAWAGGVTGRIDLYPEGPENDIVYAVQGNILTGEAVVLAAEAAIRDTPGDLAEKLMAAMESAYAFGGDGRCSCTTGGPTDCGAPPPSFIKTADVGYMLIGRLGDRDLGASFIGVPSASRVVLFGDFDGDGRADLVTTPSFSGEVRLERNSTAHPGDPLIFDSVPLFGPISQVNAGGAIDLNGDGRPEIVAVAQSGQAALVPTAPGGAFAPAVVTQVGSGIVGGVVGAFGPAGSPAIALIATGPTRLITATLDVSGGVVVTDTLPLPGTPVGVERTPSGVAVGLSNGAVIPIESNPDGSFTAGQSLAMGGTLLNLHAADFNGDGEIDFAAARTNQTVGLLLSGPGGSYTPASLAIGVAVRGSLAADLDGDGDPDLAVILSNGRYRGFLNDGSASFTQQPQRRLLDGATLHAGDLTGDGLPEVITSVAGRLGVYLNSGEGPALDEPGFAGGDYFMELNVPDGPSPGYADPVPELRNMFDAWRAAREDTPDGSVSRLFDPPARVNLQGSRSGPYEFKVQLRNYAGRLVTAPPEQFEITAPPGRPVPLVITDVQDDPDGKPGEYIVTAEATGATGRSALWVRINAQPWHAVIMPAPEIAAGLTLADMNLDGLHDLTDIVLFVTAFNAQDPAADLDGSGVFDAADLNLFITEFMAG